jgi:hypothetical protein
MGCISPAKRGSDMLDMLDSLFDAAPLLALFITVCLGYVAGKLTIGHFVLGGVAGSLLVGVLIGQLDIHIDTAMKSVFFALFIYAVGYQGGRSSSAPSIAVPSTCSPRPLSCAWSG